MRWPLRLRRCSSRRPCCTQWRWLSEPSDRLHVLRLAKYYERVVQKDGYKAWIIRWEWDGDHAAVEDPFIAALPPQFGSQKIRCFVELYYAARFLTPPEQLHYIVRKRAPNPFPARFGVATWQDEAGNVRNLRWDDQVICGDNPFIVAQRATNVVEGREPGGQEVLVWEDVQPPHRRFRHLP